MARQPATQGRGAYGPRALHSLPADAVHPEAVLLIALWLAFALPFACQCGTPGMLNPEARTALGLPAQPSMGRDALPVAGGCDSSAAAALAETLTPAGGASYADDVGSLLCWFGGSGGFDGTLAGFLKSTNSFSDQAAPAPLLAGEPAPTEKVTPGPLMLTPQVGLVPLSPPPRST